MFSYQYKYFLKENQFQCILLHLKSQVVLVNAVTKVNTIQKENFTKIVLNHHNGNSKNSFK